MAQTKDLRYRTTTPDTPDASVARYFADASGRLRYVNSAGTVVDPNTYFITTIQKNHVSSGLGAVQGGPAASYVTGYFYGSTGTAAYSTILGEPTMWIKAIGPSGQLLAIPAYTRVA